MAKISLIELAKIFLKIGIFSFGGPYAHISLFEDELINNNKLISTQSFEKGIGLCQLLPGPISTQLAIYIGLKITGFPLYISVFSYIHYLGMTFSFLMTFYFS